MKKRTRLLQPTLLACLAAPPIAASNAVDPVADSTANKMLEEVVVTATKRPERLLDVPISITAVDEATMVQSGLKSVADLNSHVPGLHLLSANVGGGINYQMRGVASQVGAATVGIYIDDTPIQNRNSKFSSSATASLFDLERIEILRGPQGTLFGASAEGGIVRFITAQPSLTHWSGHARSEVGVVAHGNSSQEVGLAIGGPLTLGRVGFRASVHARRDAGWIDRVTRSTNEIVEEDTNTGRTTSARVALKMLVTDNLSITPAIHHARTEFDDWPAYYAYLGRFRNAETIRQPSTDEFWLPTLTLHHEGEHIDITAITSYFDRRYERTDDFSTIIADIYSVAGRNSAFRIPSGLSFWTLQAPGLELVEQCNWTQEIRVMRDESARLTWTAGAFYTHARLSTGQYVTASQTINASNTGPFALMPGGYAGVSDYHLIDEQYAGFGEIGYRMTDAVQLTVGMRATRLTIDAEGSSDGFFQGGASRVGPASVSETAFTPKLSVAYQLSDANLIYASAARGFRPGGLNNTIPAANCASDISVSGPPELAYDADSVWSYEVGAKARAFGNRLGMTGSLFYVDWRDIQQTVSLPGCGSNYTRNLGRAASQGAEIEIHALIGHLTVGMNAAYTDAQLAQNVYGNPNPTTGARALLGKDGDRVILTPEWTAAANARYDFALNAKVNSYVRAEYRFFGDYTRTPGPATSLYNARLYAGDAYSLVSMRAGVEWENLDLALFANNLLDEDTVTYRVSASFLSRFIYLDSTPQPRTVGVSATYKW